jgi:hypothetical protein
MGLPGCSSWFSSAEVDDARVGRWRHSHDGLYLTAKPSHMGVDVDGLAYPLHRPMVCDHQTRGQSFLSDAALSHHAAVGSGAFLRVATPRLRYSMEC